jgi:Holliday junction resolvase RusA-like endonuclease
MTEFIIPGCPVGKGRPKFSTVNGHAVAYTPAKTVSYENLVRLSYQQQCSGQIYDKDVQLRVRIEAYFPIPKSTSKKNREAMELGYIYHTKKPDCDNIAKACLDALNGVAFYDDSQVCVLAVSKRYSKEPCVRISINEVKV